MLSRADLVGQALATWAEYAHDGDTWSDSDLGSDGAVSFALGRGDVHAEDFIQPYAMASWNDHQVRAAIRALAVAEDKERKPWSLTAEEKPRRASDGATPTRWRRSTSCGAEEIPAPATDGRLFVFPWPLAEQAGVPSPDALSAIRVLTDLVPHGVSLAVYDTHEATVETDHAALVAARTLVTRALCHMTAIALRAYAPGELVWAYVSARFVTDSDPASLVHMGIDPKALEAWVLRTLLPNEAVVEAGLPTGTPVLNSWPLAQIEILPVANMSGEVVACSPIMSVVGSILRGVQAPNT